MTKMKKTDHTKFWKACGIIRTLISGGNVKWYISSGTRWKTFRQFLEKPNTQLPYNPGIPCLDIHPGKMKDLHTNAHSRVNSPKQRTINWGRDTPMIEYPHNEILLSNKKESSIDTPDKWSSK